MQDEEMTIFLLDTIYKHTCAGRGVAARPRGLQNLTCANDDFPPLGYESAVTCDRGVDLLYRIAGRR